eukprot:gene34689-34676_t
MSAMSELQGVEGSPASPGKEREKTELPTAPEEDDEGGAIAARIADGLLRPGSAHLSAASGADE